jgi:hypothetical protein
MKRSLFPLLLSAALLVCCRGSERNAAASVVSSTPRSASGATEASSSSTKAVRGCTRTGKWALCSVERRLDQSGFVVRRDTVRPVRRAGFSVLPAIYILGRARLEVFLYPTAEAAQKDVAALDTVTVAPRGSHGAWPTPPTFVRNVNLIAVFLTDSPVQGERLTLALAAGPPQP